MSVFDVVGRVLIIYVCSFNFFLLRRYECCCYYFNIDVDMDGGAKMRLFYSGYVLMMVELEVEVRLGVGVREGGSVWRGLCVRKDLESR